MATYIVDGDCSYVELPPTAIDKLNSRINETNNRVNQITPFEESKQAYIGDTQVVFNKAKDGVINANVIAESGISVPNTLEIAESIIVKFDALEELATVSISIQ